MLSIRSKYFLFIFTTIFQVIKCDWFEPLPNRVHLSAKNYFRRPESTRSIPTFDRFNTFFLQQIKI